MAVELAAWAGILEGEELAHVGTEPAREARTAPFPDELHPKVRAALEARGVTELYEHQRAAWDAAARGSTSPSSPARRAGSRSPSTSRSRRARGRAEEARDLPLPDEGARPGPAALATDLKVPRVKPAIYDGDTEAERRWQIRKWSNLVLSNPDMLHVGVLPHHDRWGDVLSNLAYVVVDEAHVYRGVFGSHVGNVLRRLRRLARVYGADPQFLFASATIANPGELARSLTGLDVTVSRTTPHRVPSGRSRSGTRRSSTRSSASARPRSARRHG